MKHFPEPWFRVVTTLSHNPLALVAGVLLCLSPIAARGQSMSFAGAQSATSPNTGAAETSATTGQLSALNAAYGKLPLSFEANQGQSDPRVRFTSRGNGYALFLTDKEAVLALTKRDAADKKLERKAGPGKPSLSPAKDARLNLAKTDVVRMELAGASHGLRVSGAEQLPGRANYFIGNDPAKWHSNIPTYSKVRYSGVYPGVDLVYYGNQQQLEYDFVVAPGANPKPVRLRFGGAEKLQLNADGDLKVVARNGEIAFHKPVVYQIKEGQRQPVQGRFAVLAKNTVGFALGSYDQSRELVIDPTLAYSTYLGGSGKDGAGAIAVDGEGHAYVAGSATSSDFPVTGGAFQKTNNSFLYTAFVTKLNLAGSALDYSTYLGGSGGNPDSVFNSGDGAGGIAVDASGHAYVAGATYSTDFPVTSGAFQTVNKAAANNASNAFVSKLNTTGSALDYSTYLGGSGSNADYAFHGDGAYGIAVDASGHAYVTGFTASTDFPVTSGAFQRVNNGVGAANSNAFVTKLNFEGSDLKYSTYLGGSYLDYGEGICVDGAGHAYVTGTANSTDFPVTIGAFQKVNKAAANGESNVFVTKLNSEGSNLKYSTYLGGSPSEDNNGAFGAGDSASAIAVDLEGHAYVTGATSSTEFPVTSSAFQKVYNAPAGPSNQNAFVTKLNLEGSDLKYSTYLGGSTFDGASAISVDSGGHAYVTGYTYSTDFPVTSGAFQKVNNAAANVGTNAFVTKLNIEGSDLKYSTYLGGSGKVYRNEFGSGIAVDASGNVYVTGRATSADFPVTSGAFQKVNKSAGDPPENAFVTKFTW